MSRGFSSESMASGVASPAVAASIPYNVGLRARSYDGSAGFPKLSQARDDGNEHHSNGQAMERPHRTYLLPLLSNATRWSMRSFCAFFPLVFAVLLDGKDHIEDFKLHFTNCARSTSYVCLTFSLKTVPE